MTTNKNNASSTFLGKYRQLAISITLLIALVVALLVLNLFFSNQLAKSTETTDIAAQQVTLSEQISKDLVFILVRFQNGLNYAEDKENLQDTLSQFDTRINAFANGGSVMKPTILGQEEINIEPVSSERAKAIIEETLPIWEGYLRTSDILFQTEEVQFNDLFWANDYSDLNGERLTQLMVDLLDEVRSQGEQSIQYLRIAQIIGIVLVMLIFFWVIGRTVRNLRDSDAKLDRAQQETTGIMNTVREGLFLLDSDLIIGSQYSNETEEIFETRRVGEQQFSDLMQGVLTPAEIDTAEEFIKLLFNPDVIADLTEGLNPLEQIEVNLVQENGASVSKFLSFTFYQVAQYDDIQGVLVSVRDITDEVLLAEQLKESKEKGDQQVEMLLSFLHADPIRLEKFLGEAKKSLNDINNILKETVSGKDDYRQKTERIFVEVHRLKGESSAMNINALADKAHDFEEDLVGLRKSEYIEGLDFLPLAIRLDEMIQYVDSLALMLSRVRDFGANSENSAKFITGMSGSSVTPIHSAAASSLPSSEKWSYLTTTAQKAADDLGKPVKFTMSGLDESNLTPEYSEFINDIGIQLVRNAIVHGIESGDERINKLKGEVGHISLDVSHTVDGSIKCLFRDDGRGLDIDKIRHKIVDQGLSTQEEVALWEDRKVAKTVFLSGFSTEDEANMHAGRGVGLNVIQSQVKKMGGKLAMRQKAGVFCEFEIILPPQQSQSA